MMPDIETIAAAVLPVGRIRRDEPMARHTTMGVGGAADWFLLPETEEELISLVQALSDAGVPYFVLGGGANLLVRDKGIRGVVIAMNRLSGVEFSGNKITALAGTPTAAVARAACDARLSGLEFAAGIPGTIGGAAYMNAGAFGGDMSQVVRRVVTLDKAGALHTYETSEMDYQYRHSRFMDDSETMVKVEMELLPGNQETIAARMKEYQQKRRETQPSDRSAGSTFKRPDGVAAAKLIDDSGLKGFSVGGAAVSEKHAGFVVNRGHATCADVLAVMEEVRNRVRERYEILLEPEVRIIGE